METIINHNLTEETLNKFKECFDLNGSPKSSDKIYWQFFNNTEKKSFVQIAIDEGSNNRTAAIYAISCVRFKVNNESVLASQSLDTITDINYRGKGLFVSLAKEVYDLAEKSGTKIVYGFPNGNSIHGFEKKLEWKVLDPLPFLIKPLNTQYFTNKSKKLSWIPNIQIAKKSKINKLVVLKTANTFPIEVNDIWTKFSKDIQVSVIRDKVYLDWRYLEKPFENYQIIHAYTQDGIYVGYIVYCLKEKHGGNVAYIMEYIFDPQYNDLASNLLKYATNDLINKKADCILSWCFEHSFNFKNYRKVGFYKLPEKLRPIELHFGVRSFDKALEPIITNRRNWYLSYSDSDTV